MSNADVIAAVERWQSEPLVQALICRSTGCSGKLVPFERRHRVVLSCPVCGEYQSLIPEIVLAFKGFDEASRAFWQPQVSGQPKPKGRHG